MNREEWIRERRRINEARMDQIFAPIYDERWGSYINLTHLQMVHAFLTMLPPTPHVLGAACGTGKYWTILVEADATLVGIDQSIGMLRRAKAKFPEVTVEKRGLQEMSFGDQFDGIMCVDAMENVAPDNWPRVLDNFHRAGPFLRRWCPTQ